MRVTKEAMDTSHTRIVEGAARLFREQGVRDTSVADAMHEAGLTHGGFYRHFRTKDDLVIAALRAAFEEFATPLELRQALECPADVAAEYKAVYLSNDHVEHRGRGCPMPALGSDVARESPQIREEFAAGLQRVITALAGTKDGSESERQAAAAREVAMLVGAVVLARASDGPTAARMLDACRD